MTKETMVIGGVIISVIILGWLWVRGIDKMHNDHPDYKGDDFLN